MALARRGAIVSGVDASERCWRWRRRRAADEGLDASISRKGDAHALAFPDRAFDAAVCFRLLMHVPDWRRSIRELCRVAGTRIVFDFPVRHQQRRALEARRRAAAALGSKVAYRVFTRERSRARLRATVFASPRRRRSSCCRSPRTNGWDRRA